MNIKEEWKKLSPKHQRYVAVGGIAVALLTVVAVFMPGGGNVEKTSKKDKETIRNIITDADTRKVGIDGLNADMQIQERNLEETKKSLDNLMQRLADEKKQSEAQHADEMKRLREEMNQLRARPSDPASGTQESATGSTRPYSADPFDLNPLAEMAAAQRSAQNGGPLAGGGSGYEVRVISQDGTGGGQLQLAAAGGSSAPKDQPTSTEPRDPNEYEAYLPPGSILTGTIITGVDAPTGQIARREPFPMMMRISKEALLPNEYLADVRECFVLVGTYGDLASERVYGRGESVSCIRNDGKVLESKLDGYISGEDGKNGVRGRLINRDGPMLMRAALAGFLQAWSGAMSATPVPVVATTASNTVQYQDVLSSQALRNAAAQGAGKAFEKLADYYLRLADQTQPIIECDAGREINMILTGSLRLRLRDGSR